ncbi:unnamed protein product [Amoebophrya sp. A25]|nr:unnamed protein product [Amoebophrya sp. A25]|eukprot:GSA25T00021819001.1
MSTSTTETAGESESDYVAHSFLFIKGTMLCCAAFFAWQVFFVPRKWVTPMIVTALVCFVAWQHYVLMADEWKDTKSAPTVYRYMDWFLTVPLQVILFYLVIRAATPADKKPVHFSLAVRLFATSSLMLLFGYMGEVDIMDPIVAFVLSFSMYALVLYEIFGGEAAKINRKLGLDEAKRFLAIMSGQIDEESSDDEDAARRGNPNNMLSRSELQNKKELKSLKKSIERVTGRKQDPKALMMQEFERPEAQVAFETMRLIVLIGWMLYPVAYIVGYSHASKEDGHWVLSSGEEKALNLIYNVADLLNKCVFGFAIFFAAASETERDKEIRNERIQVERVNAEYLMPSGKTGATSTTGLFGGRMMPQQGMFQLGGGRLMMPPPAGGGFGPFGFTAAKPGDGAGDVLGASIKSNTLMQPGILAASPTLLGSPTVRGAKDAGEGAHSDRGSPKASKFTVTGVVSPGTASPREVLTAAAAQASPGRNGNIGSSSSSQQQHDSNNGSGGAGGSGVMSTAGIPGGAPVAFGGGFPSGTMMPGQQFFAPGGGNFMQTPASGSSFMAVTPQAGGMQPMGVGMPMMVPQHPNMMHMPQQYNYGYPAMGYSGQDFGRPVDHGNTRTIERGASGGGGGYTIANPTYGRGVPSKQGADTPSDFEDDVAHNISLSKRGGPIVSGGESGGDQKPRRASISVDPLTGGISLGGGGKKRSSITMNPETGGICIGDAKNGGMEIVLKGSKRSSTTKSPAKKVSAGGDGQMIVIS